MSKCNTAEEQERTRLAVKKFRAVEVRQRAWLAAQEFMAEFRLADEAEVATDRLAEIIMEQMANEQG